MAVSNHAIAASPNSSEEVESHHGTPATKLSPFSPEYILEDLKAGGQGIVRPNVPPAFNLACDNTNFASKGKAGNTSSLSSQDPFVSAPALTPTTRSSAGASKLSPTALNFTPATSTCLPSGHGFPASVSSRQGGVAATVLLALPPGSQTSPNHTIASGRILSGHSSTDKLSPGKSTASSMNGYGLRHGQFSSDGRVSRSLMISQITPETSVKDIQAIFNVSLDNEERGCTY